MALGTAGEPRAAALIVEEGRANAEIVIAETPPRMVSLAAEELRLFVRKISGAELPIRNRLSGAQGVTVYVGKSQLTDRLGVSAEGLKHGAS